MNTLFFSAAAIASIAAAFAFAPRKEVRTEVVIDALPSAVWSVLIDAAAYRDWNPFLVEMKGTPTAGATLENTMKPEGGSAMTFRPTVLVADEGRELRWLGRLLLPRIFDGEHYFLLEPTENGGTRLVHGETFRGVLLWLFGTDRFAADFERMNVALKRRVEEQQI